MTEPNAKPGKVQPEYRKTGQKLPRPTKEHGAEARLVTCPECGYTGGRHAKSCPRNDA